jgi:TPR repeat protein
VPRNPVRARHWLERAVSQGHGRASVALRGLLRSPRQTGRAGSPRKSADGGRVARGT